MTQNDKTDHALTAKIKNSLDASLMDMDADTQQRLAQIRHRALNQQASQSWLSRYLSSHWAPATGLVFCSVLALFMFMPSKQIASMPDYSGQTAVLELLESADDLDTLTDPDFYLWVDETEQNHAV